MSLLMSSLLSLVNGVCMLKASFGLHQTERKLPFPEVVVLGKVDQVLVLGLQWGTLVLFIEGWILGSKCRALLGSCRFPCTPRSV